MAGDRSSVSHSEYVHHLSTVQNFVYSKVGMRNAGFPNQLASEVFSTLNLKRNNPDGNGHTYDDMTYENWSVLCKSDDRKNILSSLLTNLEKTA